VQSCIVHQIRNSMRYVTYRDRKQVAADPKPVYGAVNADAAAEALQAFDQSWGERYPMIADSWRTRWQHITPFLALPAEPSTPPTASRTSTARSARRSRPAATTPTNRPPPSSSTSPSSEPKRNGRPATTGPTRSQPSRSTSATDSLTPQSDIHIFTPPGVTVTFTQGAYTESRTLRVRPRATPSPSRSLTSSRSLTGRSRTPRKPCGCSRLPRPGSSPRSAPGTRRCSRVRPTSTQSASPRPDLWRRRVTATRCSAPLSSPRRTAVCLWACPSARPAARRDAQARVSR
jgi:hypothetical protein